MTIEAGDRVAIEYVGRFEDGSVFGTSRYAVAHEHGLDDAQDRDESDYSPLAFTVGADEVIEGLDEVVRGMVVGEAATVTVPPEAAYGEVREDYGAASLAYVERAIELATDGAVDAIATAPINKQATRCAGSTYAGHTGMLADYTDTDEYAMLLVEGLDSVASETPRADGAGGSVDADLIVTHVSTHVPLTEACNRVSRGRVRTTVDVTHEGLRDLGIDDPTIAVAGLNPHASDGGILGIAEGSEIEPAVDDARADGLDVHGPESPDTVFAQAAAGAYDCVVAMYHDQGHIPIKMLGFASDDAVSGVNVTAGLPIVRTSVDHGTAFDIAGEGCASEASMVDAVEVAARIARNRARREDGDGAEAADLPDARSD